ncbi:MAG: CsiV family protein [Moritella sp.]|uniref:CsiV family protein n=1 Tax=Moritella sp. TaxID=78556 RepID=UPI0029BF0079|nr:CsiV family protein [Moritella sp.]MDX2321087.1 CsiV family protein [Moritella sp.]
MKKSLVSLLVGLSVGSSFAVSAADEERWFEVEVILFERNINPARVIEHWDQSLYPTYSKKNKDPMALFINKDNLITPNGSADIDGQADITLATGELQPTLIDDSNSLPVFGSDRDEQVLQNTDTNADIISATNVVIDGANLKDKLKDPALQIVPANELQLTKQFKALNDHANYNVVLHSAWRMQPKDRNEAIPIRLFAGQNYQQQYKMNGDAVAQKMIPVGSPIIAAPVSNDLTGNVSNNADESNVIDLDNVTTIDDSTVTHVNSAQASNETVPVSPAEPTPPVWKIDGELTIYLEHYLYAKTNLFVRKEGTKTISAKQINAAESNQSDLAPNTENIDLLALLGIHLEPKAANNNEVALTTAEVSSEVTGDDVIIEDVIATNDGDDSSVSNLEAGITKPQDKTVPFLNSYPMQQLRVIRSGEIHYLDHPMFGMLIQIRKYEPPTTEEQL